MTDRQWRSASGLAYLGMDGSIRLVRVDTAWALLRFFRTGEDWGSQEVKRRWAREEYAMFLERDAVPRRSIRPSLTLVPERP